MKVSFQSWETEWMTARQKRVTSVEDEDAEQVHLVSTQKYVGGRSDATASVGRGQLQKCDS